MKYLNFDTNRPYDLILLGRVAIDLNPAVSEGLKSMLGAALQISLVV